MNWVREKLNQSWNVVFMFYNLKIALIFFYLFEVLFFQITKKKMIIKNFCLLVICVVI